MVTNLMTTFNEKVSKIQTEVCDLRAGNSLLRRAQEQQSEQFEEIINKLEEIEGICEGVRVDAQPINELLDNLENRSRSNNLRLEGIADSNRENWEQTVEHVGNIVREKLCIEGDISLQRAHRVGSDNSNRPRTIIANFLKFQDRRKILRNRYPLKGSNIYVNEDLCVASIAKRRQQLPELQRDRREGKIAFFVHTKLISKERVLVGGGHIVGGGIGSQETIVSVDSAA